MPSVAEHFVAKFTNDGVSATNYQLVDVDLQAIGGTLAEQAACIIAYFAGQATECAADDTRLVGLDYTPAGAPGGTPVVFPATAYASIHTAFPALPNLTAWGQNVGGAGFPCPLGTSISVSEHTATAGPTGRGRHFLPFIGRDVVSVGGVVNSTTLVNLKANFDRFIMNAFGDLPFAAVGTPVVVNALRTTMREILAVKPQPIFSNLESRRR